MIAKRTVEKHRREAEHDGAMYRFYPDAWIFEADASKTDKPRYMVQCDTPEEQRLATALKPSFVDATIVVRNASGLVSSV